MQPFSVLKIRGSAWNSSYQLWNQYMISKSLLPAIYEEYYNKSCKIMKIAKEICLTTDCCTSINTYSFHLLTVILRWNLFYLNVLKLFPVIFILWFQKPQWNRNSRCTHKIILETFFLVVNLVRGCFKSDLQFSMFIVSPLATDPS